MQANSITPSLLAHTAGPREFQFTLSDFQRIRELIYQRAGISLSESKEDMVYSRLSRRLRVHGLSKFADYLKLLQEDNEQEWEQFTNALTTNLTSFFRENHHFEALAQQLAKISSKKGIRIWSSAASTGEEPYSIAMTAVEVFGQFNVPVEIIATDLDTQVLRKGAEGVYAAERVAKLDPQRLRRFFLNGTGAQSGNVKVRPELQAIIHFQPLNLLESIWKIRGPFDAIFCRNVLIYFDKETQARILRRFAPLMEHDARLYIGHSESLFHVSDAFKLLGQTVYAKVSALAGD
jgi:chemotaxis protein methyltransferase CheR